MMAASTTTTAATTHFCSSTTLRTSNGNHFSRYVRFPAARKRPRRVVFVRSAGGEVSAEETNIATSETETETETAESEEKPVEVPEGPPSLISALNVEKALRGIAITDADHYGRLGLRRGCSYDQVPIAYKNKIDELLNKGLPDEQLNTDLELLKESYSILSSVEERRLYDWSLARSDEPDRYMWPFEVDITPTPTGTPPPQEPEDVVPTRLVGYFIFGWFILSVILSIVFNR